MPLHSAPSNNLFEIYSPEQKARFRLIRGHFTFLLNDQGTYKYIPQNTVRITMLRDLIERVQSGYRYLRRNPSIEVHVKRIMVEKGVHYPLKNPEDEHRRQRLHEEAMQQDFSKFAQNEAHFRLMYNVQTRMVLGPVPGFPRKVGDPEALSDDELLRRARASLDKFAFVGITERFFESVQVLCYTFGWPDVKEIPRLNVGQPSSDEYKFTADDLRVAQAQNALDLRLYAYAQELFSERLREMEENSTFREMDIQ